MCVARIISDRPLVLVTGKGGVGKTTLATAMGLAAQSAGRKTLVAEITSDPLAKSQLLTLLADSLSVSVTEQGRSENPIQLGPNLDGVKISPAIGHRLFLRAALRVNMVADAAMRSSALNRFLMAAPAFPEIGVLYQLIWLWRLKRYDQIIVDLPATGHALGLAKLPRTVARVVPKGLINEAVTEGLDLLTDADRCGVVVATIPENLPVTEAFELRSGLSELGVSVGAMVLNRMPADRFSEDEEQALDGYIRMHRDELLLGSREFRRIQRAKAAQALFNQDVRRFADIMTAELPVVRGADAEVVREVVGRLSQADMFPAGEVSVPAAGDR